MKQVLMTLITLTVLSPSIMGMEKSKAHPTRRTSDPLPIVRVNKHPNSDWFLDIQNSKDKNGIIVKTEMFNAAMLTWVKNTNTARLEGNKRLQDVLEERNKGIIPRYDSSSSEEEKTSSSSEDSEKIADDSWSITEDGCGVCDQQ